MKYGRDGVIWKLLQPGLSKTLVRWVRAWLSNKQAWIEINGMPNKPKVMHQGLPQGSVLSPILFIVYTKDVLKDVNVSNSLSVSMFADDIAL